MSATSDDAGDGSGSMDSSDGDVTDPCTPGFLDLCDEPPPDLTLHITGADTINTDTDPRCRTYVQASGGPVCLVYATSVAIDGGGSLTATGSRPLAIASASMMTIGGSLDVSSRRAGARGPAADDAACAAMTNPENDLGGAGGAAGGSFAGKGGDGGTGDTDDSLGNDGPASPGTAGAAVASIALLRGGCRGQDGANEASNGGQGGAGGHSGGALYLYAAGSIEIGGTVRATGAGGDGGQVQAGGGGGGSGGLVVIESKTITIAGQISANGGGGGEGGARVGTTPVSGQPGEDGTFGISPAPGGMGSDDRFGYGGDGGAGTTAAETGTTSIIAGGGGGGGVGFVMLIGTASTSGVISPPPM